MNESLQHPLAAVPLPAGMLAAELNLTELKRFVRSNDTVATDIFGVQKYLINSKQIYVLNFVPYCTENESNRDLKTEVRIEL